MSEQTITEPGSETDLAAEVEQWKAEAEKWKSMSRKNEERAKDNAEKAVKYDELAPKLEELQKRADDAETKLSERDAADERAKLVAEVAKTKGITDPSVLVGDSQEELEAFADKIKALIPETPRAPGAGVQGEQGSDITPTDEEPTANDLIRAAAKN